MSTHIYFCLVFHIFLYLFCIYVIYILLLLLFNSVYSRSSRAVFGLLGFITLSILLDIIYLSVWFSNDSDSNILSNISSQASTTTKFSVTMIVFNIFAKLALIYYGSHLFIVLSNEDDIIETSTSLKSESSESPTKQRHDENNVPTPLSTPITTYERDPSTQSPVHSIPALNFNTHTPSHIQSTTPLASDRTDTL